ncbi:MAG: 4-oxalocrotonate tautomerase DmpI [Promethearchaeota archaeon]
MPNIIIEGPALPDMDAKRAMVKEITDAVEKAYKHVPREHIVVTIKEVSPENVGVGGVLIADRRKS